MNLLHLLSVPSKTNAPRPGSPVALALLCLAGLLSQGCSHIVKPQEFATPGEAEQALVGALRAGDTQRLLSIFGTEGEEIIFSGDDVSDRQRYAKFLALYDEKHSLQVDGEDSRTMVIGKDDWPFPVPVVREEQRWFFDAEAGKEEILNRRIGQNELSAIQVCKAVGDAQQEYALRDPDNDGVHTYAQQFPSDPGKHNGLFWPAAEGEEPSPLGDSVAAAAAEGYKRKEGSPTPYHGYCYRILKAQGPNAPGGTLDYVVNGKMILGYALVAYPADYGNSGIMTFIMGVDGVVYQRDLGDDTEKLGLAMKTFDPDPGWKKAE